MAYVNSVGMLFLERATDTRLSPAPTTLVDDFYDVAASQAVVFPSRFMTSAVKDAGKR